jgi:hypothetical protein
MTNERARQVCIKLTIIALALVLLDMLVGCGGKRQPTPVSLDTGTYTGVLHWTVRGKVFEDQKVTIEVTQEGTSLSVRGKLTFPRDVAPLPPLTCALDGSSCRSAGIAEDSTCGHYELVSADLRFSNGRLDYSGVSNSEWCEQWHLFGILQR